MNRRSFFTRFAGFAALVGVAKSLKAEPKPDKPHFVDPPARILFYDDAKRIEELRKNLPRPSTVVHDTLQVPFITMDGSCIGLEFHKKYFPKIGLRGGFVEWEF